MRKFWGYYDNGTYRVGCDGGTVYIYDQADRELAKFRDIPYAYTAAFQPGTNLLAVKSTEGRLAFYDLDTLTLLKKITVTRIGAQDEGFAFSPDGAYFYNIEKPIQSYRTQLTKYRMADFSVETVLFDTNADVCLETLEFDEEGRCWVLGFLRDEIGVFDRGFVGELREREKKIRGRTLALEVCEYAMWYKHWEKSGFTERALPSYLEKMETRPHVDLRKLAQEGTI